jgi:hypothetical protein
MLVLGAALVVVLAMALAGAAYTHGIAAWIAHQPTATPPGGTRGILPSGTFPTMGPLVPFTPFSTPTPPQHGIIVGP